MGRRMFSGGEGPWEDDANADGWWGDETPFDVPVFVLTHHARETVVKNDGSTFAFVTEGIEAAVDQARAAAGERDVTLSGGASVIQQGLIHGLVDELLLHLAPVLLGDGVRRVDGMASPQVELETLRVVESPAVTHITYRTRR
jgi:dihydrofolate reductase